MRAAARRLDADGASLTVCSVTITSNRTALVPDAMGPMMGVVYAGDARDPIGGKAVSVLFCARNNLPARAMDGKEGSR